MKNSKKIYLKAYTRMNLGDDLFIYIICSRYPQCIFYLKKQEIYMNTFNDIPNLNIINDIENLQFDAIVYIGGSIFIESSKESSLRVLNLKNEIFINNIPTYIIGANFGPYTTEEYYKTVKNIILLKTESTTFRDKYSYELFKDMTNVHYAPDVVFTLNTNEMKKEEKQEIGISIIHHLEREKIKDNYVKYIDKLVEISKFYINKGYKIRLFSFCEYEKDMLAIKDLLNKMNESELENIVISNYCGNINEILKDIVNLKLFIATRFHSMILGLKFNVPIIPICYSGKMLNVLNDIEFDKNNIYTFDTLEKIEYKKIPKVFLSDKFQKANEQFKELDKLLL